MKLLITGGTGLIGSTLCHAMQTRTDQLTILSRSPGKVKEICGPNATGISRLDAIDAETRFDAIINLAGEPLIGKRWNEKRKHLFEDSRIQITQHVISLIKRLEHKPDVLVNGSAIGYYGNRHDQTLSEASPAGEGFSPHLCELWENTALEAQASGVRVCCLRTGLVLSTHGGALTKMLPAFRIGLGGSLSDGHQWMSWIHIQDLVGVIKLCMSNRDIKGPVNGTSPNPVTNKDFTVTLGHILHRPTVATAPAFVLKLAFGEMADELLLSSQRVLPEKITHHGYNFLYPTLKMALFDLIETHQKAA